MNLAETVWVEKMMVWNKESSVWFEKIQNLAESGMVERIMVWKERSLKAFD